jgi:putative transposase
MRPIASRSIITINSESGGCGTSKKGVGSLFPKKTPDPFSARSVQADDHLYSLLRYVERNALRAGLVKKAEEWRWSSLSHRLLGAEPKDRLSLWPVSMPRNWVEQVNRPQTEAEVAALRRSVKRGRPYGDEEWEVRTAKALHLESTLRERGRPKKRA